MARTIAETFNKGSDGWTMTGDVKSSGWQSTGGDPKGYFNWVDSATGAVAYYQAGMKFLGNHAAFYGGTLSYDILDSGNGYQDYDVKMIGAGKTLEYTNPNNASFPTPSVWTAASVELVATNFIDTATGQAPTISDFKAVLKDITELDIRAEYVNGAETGGLDNVKLTHATTPATSALSSSDTRFHEHFSAASAVHHADRLQGALRGITHIAF